MTREEERIEKALENLFRIVEFRRWVQSNVLFPQVVDAITHPLVAHLKAAEHSLLALLYDYDAIDRVSSMQRVTASALVHKME